MRLDAGEDGVPYYVPPPTSGESGEVPAPESSVSTIEPAPAGEDEA